MLFQELWQRGLKWEDRSDEDITDQWRSWKSELSQLSCITIPRYFMGNIESSSSIELHGFGYQTSKMKFQQTKAQRGSDTCISRSLLTISGNAGVESTYSSYPSDRGG